MQEIRGLQSSQDQLQSKGPGEVGAQKPGDCLLLHHPPQIQRQSLFVRSLHPSVWAVENRLGSRVPAKCPEEPRRHHRRFACCASPREAVRRSFHQDTIQRHFASLCPCWAVLGDPKDHLQSPSSSVACTLTCSPPASSSVSWPALPSLHRPHRRIRRQTTIHSHSVPRCCCHASGAFRIVLLSSSLACQCPYVAVSNR